MRGSPRCSKNTTRTLPESLTRFLPSPACTQEICAKRRVNSALRLQGGALPVPQEAQELSIAMRDGEELATRIWMPDADGPLPVILERGYEPGYIYVGQQCRGNLEGGMFRTDDVDGYDCIDWVSKQSWCNGDVAMYGRSFMAATQWLTAPIQHPALKAIVPQVVNPRMWERGYWDHGALQLSHTARRIYRTRISDDNTHKVFEFGGWGAFYRHPPRAARRTSRARLRPRRRQRLHRLHALRRLAGAADRRVRRNRDPRRSQDRGAGAVPPGALYVGVYVGTRCNVPLPCAPIRCQIRTADRSASHVPNLGYAKFRCTNPVGVNRMIVRCPSS